MIYNLDMETGNVGKMTDKGPQIRDFARKGKVRYSRHAIERIRQYRLTVMQVTQMLKNCSHNQSLDDNNGHRVEGRASAFDALGTRRISAHVRLANEELIVVITVING